MFLTKYLLPFEVASVLLLVVLIGAVAVARKEVRDE
jgi:NADH:ubiquinone oxidoreductase subunit 6 (subunit J)